MKYNFFNDPPPPPPDSATARAYQLKKKKGTHAVGAYWICTGYISSTLSQMKYPYIDVQ
jgi:hypothetical protein